MKDFTGVVDMQVAGLLEAVQSQQSTRCQELASRARERATALLKAARRQSRVRMHQAVVEERQRIDAAMLQAHGRIRTQERRQLQQHYKELLNEGWLLLEAELRARWQEPGQRRAWCESLLADAIKVFADASLVIEHPPGWPGDDQAWLRGQLRKTLGAEATFQADETIECGLRMRTSHACLNGTLDGLMDDRRQVESVFLAAWEAADAELRKRDISDTGGDKHD